MPLLGTEELDVDDSEVREDEGVNERPLEDAEDVESLFSSRSVKL